ncbi:type VI secretion system tip protein VgrG [Gracilimonas mengyeensis]|uniref:Rhs element Vgr protein n=1 Tax=Gracilimonas mengyeensis TaxID=1302730 RepID=A0A521BNG0_9BACT|nr:type VI secretion system tip protein VgrG [Gracilimonas mengyeensis]SMO48629.1 Rhs element Vgr protein [Gracilimonas mengyeensis]
MAGTSPVSSKTTTVSFSILLNGSEMDQTYQLSDIEVSKAVNRIPFARVTLFDGSTSKADFPISNKADFLPGTEIEIKAGYQSTNKTIFKGIITKHGIRIRKNQSVLVVECRDKAVKMTVGRKNAFYKDKTDSDIISSLIGNYSLSSDVASTSVTHKEVVQFYVSDWDFMMMRADVNSLIVLTNDGKVTVKKPDTSSSAVLSLAYGGTILDFQAEMESRTQLSAAKASAWDMAEQKLVQADGTASDATLPGNVSGSTLSDVIGLDSYQLQSISNVPNDELKEWASSKLQKAKLSQTTGKVKFQGNEAAKPGTMIELSGVGARFNGKVFVSAVTHIIKGGEWITEAQFGLNFDWFVEEVDNIDAPANGGLMPAMKGLHIGTVKQIDQDPDGANRVLVVLPLLQDEQGIWARIANFYSTSGSGCFFMPEINDEVIVGFLDENPNYPVILGSMYSKKNAPPYTPDDKNSTKAIVTKNKLEINFQDEDKVITIKTPGGNKMIYSDKDKSITIEDQNSNKAVFDSSGINIQSPADITIKAGGNLNLQSTGNTSVKADANVDISGLQISNSADTKFSANGNAASEITASGQVKIQGAMVMIN